MDAQPRTDEQLMEEFARTGSEFSIGDLVSRYTSPGVSFAAYMLGDRLEAEDAVQETFLRIVRSRRKFRKQKKFKSWFYTILRNICLDFHRKGKPVPSDEIPAAAAEGENRTDLLEVLDTEEQSLLRLKLVHGYSLKEIAEFAGCSPEAAKKRCQRALSRLREKLHALEGLEEGTL